MRTRRYYNWLGLGLMAGVIFLVGAESSAQDFDLRTPGLPKEEEEVDPHAPGKHHAQFEKAVGKFEAVVRSYPEAGGEPVVTKAEAVGELILGGRFLQLDYKGASPVNTKLIGLGLYGYDERSEKHSALWLDSFSNSTFFAEGECAKRGMITMHGNAIDPDTDKVVKMQAVLHLQSYTQFTYAEYEENADGKWLPQREILFTRIPGSDRSLRGDKPYGKERLKR